MRTRSAEESLLNASKDTAAATAILINADDAPGVQRQPGKPHDKDLLPEYEVVRVGKYLSFFPR